MIKGEINMFELILFIVAISCILILISFKLHSSIMKFRTRSKLNSILKATVNAPLPINIDLSYCAKLQEEINSKWLDVYEVYLLENLNDFLEEARLWHTEDETELKRLQIQYAIQIIANLYINLENQLNTWNSLKLRNEIDPDLKISVKSIEKEIGRVKESLDVVSPFEVRIKNKELANDPKELKEIITELSSLLPKKQFKTWHVKSEAILQKL
jgi:hypothetical protein